MPDKNTHRSFKDDSQRVLGLLSRFIVNLVIGAELFNAPIRKDTCVNVMRAKVDRCLTMYAWINEAIADIRNHLLVDQIEYPILRVTWILAVLLEVRLDLVRFLPIVPEVFRHCVSQ